MFLSCGIGLAAPMAHAQKKIIIDDEASNGIVMVTIDKAGDEIIRIMNESQLPYIHDPKAPRFLLMDKQGKFAWASAAMCAPPANTILGGLWMTLTLSPPTFQTAVKSGTNSRWMPAQPRSS